MIGFSGKRAKGRQVDLAGKIVAGENRILRNRVARVHPGLNSPDFSPVGSYSKNFQTVIARMGSKKMQL